MKRTAAKLTTLAIISAALALALAGCAGTPAPAQPLIATEEPSVPASPAPSADPLADAVALVIRPETVDLNDPSGVTLLAVSYESPAAELVDALAIAIGSAPDVYEYEEGLESPAGVRYEWSGLVVSDPEPAEGTFPGLSNLQVSVTAPSVGELESITTTQGYHIGSETEPILTENNWTVPEFGAFHFPAEFGPALGEPSGDNPAHPNAWSVAISAEPSATAITHIFAPVNFGVPGH